MRDAVLGVPFLLFPCLGLFVEEEVVFILDRVAHERLPAPVEEAEFLEEMALDGGQAQIVRPPRRHAEQLVGGDAEIERDVAHLAVARRACALLDAVEDALVQMDRVGECPLRDVALDAQIVDALSDVRPVLHPKTSLETVSRLAAAGTLTIAKPRFPSL